MRINLSILIVTVLLLATSYGVAATTKAYMRTAVETDRGIAETATERRLALSPAMRKSGAFREELLRMQQAKKKLTTAGFSATFLKKLERLKKLKQQKKLAN